MTMEVLADWVSKVSNVVWNGLLLYLLVGTGIVFTIRTRFVQVRKFGAGWKHLFGHFSLNGEKAGKDGMSPFQALTTAIAAQVGTGNIAGAATALYSGGPGAIFWMWLSAFFGMSTIYGEAVLAQKYKNTDDKGHVTGGPIYYIRARFTGKFGKFLAGFFSVAIIFALGFTGNMVQANSISVAFNTAFGAPMIVVGIICAIIAAFIFLGGVGRIASVTEKVVPIIALFNNDAFAEPDWLAELIKTADADPKIFAVSSLMLRYYEPELADDAGDYVTILGFACKRGDGLKASRYTKPCRVFSACGGAALYRKSILDEIGVFDELFFAYYEDVDLSWRANNFGYRNVYCPTARCRHICGATTGAVRYNPFKSIQSGRNSILLPYKNQPILMLVLNFIPMLLGYLLKVLMFRLRGFGGDYAKGFREAWTALPKINKPKFKWRNLPNYVWVEFSLIAGLFKYIVYRVQRALKIT